MSTPANDPTTTEEILELEAEESASAAAAPGLKGQFIIDIQDKIISGKWAPGMQLPSERDLAAQFGLSKSLVNSALTELQTQGFLKMVPRTGNFVADIAKEGTLDTLMAIIRHEKEDFSLQLFNDIMDTRRLIECECARLACTNGTSEDFEKMVQHFSEMRKAESQEAYIAAVYAFHCTIIRSSKNSIYVMIFQGFEPILRHIMFQHMDYAVSDRETYYALHGRLIEHMRRGDDVRADECLKTILDMGESALRKRYI